MENRGTLPIYIHLGMNATAGNDTEPVLYGDNKYEIDQDQYADKPCANTLEDALKIFVYKKDGDTWTRLENINLNKETATSNEKICYDPTDFIGANEEVTYIIGGYLPSTAGNEYQGQHYHGALEVTAQQADLGPYDHNETGEDPAEFVVNVPVQIADQSDPSNPDYLVGVESIPMTFDKDTTTASAAEIIRQLREFLAKNLIEGKQWTLYGTIPAEFAIVYDEDTGEHNAVFGGDVQFLLVSVLPAQIFIE